MPDHHGDLAVVGRVASTPTSGRPCTPWASSSSSGIAAAFGLQLCRPSLAYIRKTCSTGRSTPFRELPVAGKPGLVLKGEGPGQRAFEVDVGAPPAARCACSWPPCSWSTSCRCGRRSAGRGRRRSPRVVLADDDGFVLQRARPRSSGSRWQCPSAATAMPMRTWPSTKRGAFGGRTESPSAPTAGRVVLAADHVLRRP